MNKEMNSETFKENLQMICEFETRNLNNKRTQIQYHSSQGTNLRDKIISILPADWVLYSRWSKGSGLQFYMPLPKNEIKLSEDNGLFEVLFHKCEKLYFDIEKLSIDPLERVLEELNLLLPNDKDRIIVSRHRKINENEELKIRYSYHIIYKNITIDESDLPFIRNFCSTNKELGFDPSVYTNPKLFQAVNQSKIIVKKVETDCVFEYCIDETQDTIITQPEHLNRINWDKIDTSSWLEIPQKEFTNTDKSTIHNQTYKIDILSIPQQQLELPEKYLHYETYDFSPKEILEILPNTQRGTPTELSHNIHFTICNYCVHNNITFQEYWEWAKQKDECLSRRLKHSEMYDYIKSKKNVYKPIQRGIFYLLERFYPKILIDKQINKWRNSFVHQNDQVIHLPNQFYSSNNLNQPEKIVMLSGNMGSNKTGSVVDYTHEHPEQSCLFLTHNRALAQNVSFRLNEKKTKRNDFKLYSNIKINKKITTKEEQFNKHSHFICCMPSLQYVSRDYDIVVIDEVETFLQFLSSDTCFQNYTKSIIHFIEILNNCSKIILLDAFISKLTKDFFKYFGDIKIIQTQPRIGTRNISIDYTPFERLETIQTIENYLQNNKKLLIFYPFKKGTKSYFGIEELSCYLNRQGYKTIAHHAEDDYDLSQVNELWAEQDIVLTNSKITVGVNFDVPDYFDEVLIFSASFNSLRDLFQVSMRIRHLKTNNITFYRLGDGFFQLEEETNFSNHSLQNVIEVIPEYKPLLIELSKNWVDEINATHNVENFSFFAEICSFNIINFTGLETFLTREDTFDDDVFQYDSIRDIDEDMYEEIKIKISMGTATMEERLMYKKKRFNFFFQELENKEEIFASDSLQNNLIKLFNIKCGNSPLNKLYSFDFLNQSLKDLKEKKLNVEFNPEQLEYINITYPSINLNLPKYKNHNNILFKIINCDFGLKMYYNNYKDKDEIKQMMMNRKEFGKWLEMSNKMSVNTQILIENLEKDLNLFK